jgi:hypothetical protein
MRIRTAGRYALNVAAAAAILAGCNGSPGSQSAFAPTGPSAAAPSQPSHLTGVGKVVHVPVLVNGKLERRDKKLTPHTLAVINYWLGRKSTPNAVRGGSVHPAGFIKPGFKVGALAYVTDPGPFPVSTGNVYVYSWYNPGYPRGTMLGQLNNSFCQGNVCFTLYAPFGACSDKHQHVWITDAASSAIWEYQRNQILPINVLPDPNNIPVSCSVAPNGDLAVGNASTTTGGSGSVYVYPGATTPWVPYYNIGTPAMETMTYVGYDNKGNLFADGCASPTAGACTPATVQVVECSACSPGIFSGPLGLIGSPLVDIQFPGQLQWVGSLLTVSDWTMLAAFSDAACIAQPAGGCGMTFATTEKPPGNLTQFFTMPYDSNETLRGIWTDGNRTIAPNLAGNGAFAGSCKTPNAPSVTCTNVYIYGVGHTPNGEWDDPWYQIEPFSATTSE